MITGFKRMVKRCLRYRKAIGWKLALICVLDEIRNVNKERLVCIGCNQIYIRTNTPDLEVAISSFHDDEYGGIAIVAPKVIVDAGANIGTSSIYFAKKYPDAKIFAIEPEQNNFVQLEKNTDHYSNIKTVKAALWGEEGGKIIQDRLTGSWGYTISETLEKTESTGQIIQCITIDGFMEQNGLNNIDILKMDIEGGEKDVLEKSSNWISKVNVMTVELHDAICFGCDRAFYIATKNFKRFEKNGEKITAYRD